MSEPSTRIAMWSGPRNISTALMRSWGSRPDTYVCDEPFYAHYLARTGVDHPGREAIINDGETDWMIVSEMLAGPVPEDKRIFYQKHMAHHLFPDMQGSWMDRLSHAFLIRDPEEMLISLARVLPHPRVEDTGFPQALALYHAVRRREDPVVIDARDVLERPREMLRLLCERLGVRFTEAMLSWAPGPRSTDGPWAPYWYGAVEASTGFQPYTPPTEPLPGRLKDLERECRLYYDYLRPHRLTT